MPPIETVLEENAQLKAELSGKSERIAELEAQIAWFRRQMFAGGKSEKIDMKQLELLLSGLEQAKAEETQPKTVTYECGPAKPRRSREELYGNLPVLEETVTKPFTFTGEELEINYATSAAGSLRFELQDESGDALADSREIIGDQIARIVAWADGTSVKALAGKTIRLRVVLEDADLFSLRFR
jgi:hypothetical protein